MISQGEKDLDELATRCRVEVRRRFVEDEHVGAHREHRRQRHSPAFAEAEVVWRTIAVPAHADRAQRIGHPSVQLVAAQAQVGRPERDVLADGGHEQLVVGVLEDDADAATDLAQVRLHHGQAADGDGAPCGRVDAVEVQHQGGLAGAVGPEHRDLLAIAYDQIDAVERWAAVGVGEVQARHLEGRRRRGHRNLHAAIAHADATAAGARHATQWRGSSSRPTDGIVPV